MAQPTLSPRHIKASEPILKMTLWVVCIVGVAAIAAGAFAIYRNSLAQTEFNFLGLTMTTGHVGVALVGLGVAALILIIRRMFKTLEVLGGLKD
jgi:uncharacterized membrane protein YidH (DUF202 family)